MLRHAPDILITTPESLYLMLTSQARDLFEHTEWVILDEIHAVAQTKRGAHLAITLERLRRAGRARGPADRPERDAEPARGGRPLHGRPAPDGDGRRHRRAQAAGPRDPGAGRVDGRAGADATRRTSTRWPAARRRASRSGRRSTPRSSTSSRSTARRSSSSTTAAAPSGSRCGSTTSRPSAPRSADEPAARDRPRPPRLAGPRGAHVIEEQLKAGAAAVPRGHLVAGARHRHGRRRPRAPGRVAEVRHPRPAAHRPRRPRRRRDLQGPHLPEVPRRPARVDGGRQAHARGPDREDRRAAQPARRARPADRRHRGVGRRGRGRRGRRRCTRWSPAPTPTPSCRARSSRTCSTCSTAATRARSSASCAPRIVWDRVAGTHPRPQGRPRAGHHQRRHDPRPRPVLRQPAGRPPRRRARRGDGLRGAARARRSCSAPRPGGSRRSRATA